MLNKVAYKHADFAYALGDKIDINRGFEVNGGADVRQTDLFRRLS